MHTLVSSSNEAASSSHLFQAFEHARSSVATLIGAKGSQEPLRLPQLAPAMKTCVSVCVIFGNL